MNNKIYIRFNNKPIFAIENSLMFNKNKMLLLRKTFKNKGVGNIFILFPFKNHKMMNITRNFNAIYDSSKYEFFKNSRIKSKISYYSGIIYKNINLNNFKCEYILFRNSLLETYLSLREEENNLKYYSPEKFYILNKIIIDWTRKNFDETEKDHNYLEMVSYDYATSNVEFLYFDNQLFVLINRHPLLFPLLYYDLLLLY